MRSTRPGRTPTRPLVVAVVVAVAAYVAPALAAAPTAFASGAPSPGPRPGAGPAAPSGPARVGARGAVRAPRAAAADLVSSLRAEPAAAAKSGERELPALRGATSRTFLAPSGSRRLVSSTGPVNYRDARGAWQPIDDTLMPDPSAPAGYVNTANSYTVRFPADIAAGPIRVAAGGKWVSFRLLGAHSSTGVVSKNAITYPDVLPGVSLTYSANPEGTQELVTLANGAAPTSYQFDVASSPGLTRANRNGGVDLKASDGSTALSMPAPYVYDSGPDAAGSMDAVGLTTADRPGGLTATLALKPGWLTAPGRAFPVVIDPTIDPQGSALKDCHVVSGVATTSYCGTTAVDVGNYGNSYGVTRNLLQLDTSTIPADSTVLDAQVNLVAYQLIATTGAVSMQLRQNTQAWNTAATWNSSGTAPWTGGTPAATTLWTGSAGPKLASSTSNVDGRYSWYGTSAVQSWVNGTTPNQGFLLKATNESVAGVVRFGSSHNSSYVPDIDVDYYPPVGQQPTATFNTQQLTGHASAAINVATGNLLVRSDDLNVTGTGTSAAFSHYYNSALAHDLLAGNTGDSLNGTISPGWTSTLSQDIYLSRFGQVDPQGSVVMYAPGGTPLVFTHAAIGTNNFTAPPGVNATLTLGTTTANTSPSFDTVTFHDSGLTYHFTASPAGNEQLGSITTKNGKTTAINYNGSWGSSTSSVTDTQGRNFPFGYLPPSTDIYSPLYGKSPLTSIGDTAGSRAAGFRYSADLTQLTRYTDPAGGAYSYGYDPTSHLLTTVTSPGGRTLTIGYDNAARVSTLARNTGTATLTTRYAYLAKDSGAPSGAAAMTQVTDPMGHVTNYYYNAARQVIRTTDALNRHRDKSYDPTSGNVMSLTNNLSQATQLAYDTNRNLTQIQAPSSGGGNTAASTVLSGYTGGAQPHPTSARDPQGNTTSYGVDAASDVTDVTGAAPSSAHTHLTYNTDGTVASSTDANGNATGYGYTGGNLTSTTPPAPLGRTTISPDADSRPHVITDGKGQAVTNTYDRLDRITRVAYADGTALAYTYDGDDNVTARTDRDGGQTTITYDGLSRPTAQSFRGTAQTFVYDNANDLTSLTDPGGTVGYGYDSAGDPTSVTEPGGNCSGYTLTALPAANSGCTLFGYDNAAHRTQTATPGGVLQSTTYDGAGRQTEVKATNAGGTLSDLAYSYTKPGTTTDTNLRQSTTDKVTGRTTTYGYDELNRLTHAGAVQTSPTSGADYDYAYDKNGNRTSSTVTGGTNPGYTYNAANELTSTGATTSTYDPDGNLTATSAGFTAGYDTANTTTHATNPTGGADAALTYADAGQALRLSAGTATFTQHVLGLASTTNSGTLTSYTRDPQGTLIAARSGNTPGQTTNTYYLRDSHGSTIGLTDGTGTRTASYLYDPYGQTTSTGGTAAAANPFRYAGGYQDPNGLYHFGQRYYDPSLGRWTQRDSLSHIGDLQQGNRYAYTGDDPVNNNDPSGKDLFDDIKNTVVHYAEGCAAGVGLYVESGYAEFSAALGPEAALAGGTLACVAGGFTSDSIQR